MKNQNNRKGLKRAIRKVNLDTTETANRNALNLKILMPKGAEILNIQDLLEEIMEENYPALAETAEIEVLENLGRPYNH